MQLVIGRISRPHGVRGEVIVDVRTDDPGPRFAAGSVIAIAPMHSPAAIGGSQRAFCSSVARSTM